MKKIKVFNSNFTQFDPLIGTFLIAMLFHIPILIHDPQQFLIGLITPHIIFQMVSYYTTIQLFIRIVTSLINPTDLYKIFFKKLQTANLSKTLTIGISLELI